MLVDDLHYLRSREYRDGHSIIEDIIMRNYCIYCCCIVVLLLFAMSCRERCNDDAQCFYDRGMVIETVHPDSAVYYYRKALECADVRSNPQLVISIHWQLGDLLRTHHLYNRALEEHQKALQLSYERPEIESLPRSLREVGKDFLYKELPDSALTYIMQALKCAEDVADTNEIVAAHNNLSVAYSVTDSIYKAIEHAYHAIVMSSDSATIYRNYSAIGRMYLAENIYDSAYYYSLKGSHSANIYTQANCYRQLCEVTRCTGDTSGYAIYSALLEQADDTISQMNRTEAMGETEYRYELERVLTHEKERYQMWVAVVVLVVVVVILFYYRYKRRKERCWQQQMEGLRHTIEQRAGRLEEEVAEAERVIELAGRERERLYALIDKKGNVCALSFMRSKAYKTIKSWIDHSDGVLLASRQSATAEYVHKAFEEYEVALREHTSLTADEVLLCCLIKCRFTTKECAICKGVSENAVRTQKSRIKSKLAQSPQ